MFFHAMRLKRRNQRPEDPRSFGRRLRFVDVRVHNDVVPWPCLEFANINELQNVLHAQDSEYLACPHKQHRLMIEQLRHLQAGGSSWDPVVYLFGNKTPGGNRLVFRPSATYCYREHISRAVDMMHHEPVFVQALNMTSGILATLLSEDIATQLLPGPGEHAPAA